MTIPDVIARVAPPKEHGPVADDTMLLESMEGTDHREVEWQFDAVDLRPVERWLRRLPESGARVSGGRTRIIIDRYLDSDDWCLYRAGYTLRIRRAAGRFEATLKTRDEGASGLRSRREISQPMPGHEAAALFATGGPVGERLRAVAGRRPVRDVSEIRTRRTTFDLVLDGLAAEVALDQTTIPLDGTEPPARLRRVEVEMRSGDAADLAPLVDRMREACGLAPATLSKFEAGLLARGAEPDLALQLGIDTVDADGSVGEAAFAVLRKHFAAFLAKESGTRLGEDPEDLHDMRVATRRLRAAIALFEDVLPLRAGRLRTELAWLAALLGDVRDLDVQLEQTARWTAERSGTEAEASEALNALRAMLEHQRALARDRLLGGLDSARYDRLTGAMTEMLRHGPLRRSSASRVPVQAAAPALLKGRYKKVRGIANQLGPEPGPPELHRLRIRAKRLRYALEFLSPVYGAPADAAIRRVVAIQDALGFHQDAQVAMARLRTLVDERGADLPPAAIFVMGGIAERYAAEAAKMRKRFPKTYGRLRPKWRRLAAAMDRGRPDPGRTAHGTAPGSPRHRIRQRPSPMAG
jgi:triphosphatase